MSLKFKIWIACFIFLSIFNLIVEKNTLFFEFGKDHGIISTILFSYFLFLSYVFIIFKQNFLTNFFYSTGVYLISILLYFLINTLLSYAYYNDNRGFDFFVYLDSFSIILIAFIISLFRKKSSVM